MEQFFVAKVDVINDDEYNDNDSDSGDGDSIQTI